MPWNEALPTVILSKGVMHRGGGACTQDVYTGRAGTENLLQKRSVGETILKTASPNWRLDILMGLIIFNLVGIAFS